jgi:hypothetical protein
MGFNLIWMWDKKDVTAPPCARAAGGALRELDEGPGAAAVCGRAGQGARARAWRDGRDVSN